MYLPPSSGWKMGTWTLMQALEEYLWLEVKMPEPQKGSIKSDNAF